MRHMIGGKVTRTLGPGPVGKTKVVAHKGKQGRKTQQRRRLHAVFGHVRLAEARRAAKRQQA